MVYCIQEFSITVSYSMKRLVWDDRKQSFPNATIGPNARKLVPLIAPLPARNYMKLYLPIAFRYMSEMTFNFIHRARPLYVLYDIKLEKWAKTSGPRRKERQHAWGETRIKRRTKSQYLLESLQHNTNDCIERRPQ